MMSSYNVSTRYAKALTGLAEEHGNLQEVTSDVEMVYNTFRDSKELRVAMASPVIQDEKKLQVIDALFREKVGKDTLGFMRFLVEKKRISSASDILARFLDIVDQKSGIVRVKVKSPVEFTEDQSKKLEAKFSEMTNKDVKVTYQKDDSLIGGFIAQFGDTVVDASVKNQLRLLKKKLLQNN